MFCAAGRDIASAGRIRNCLQAGGIFVSRITQSEADQVNNDALLPQRVRGHDGIAAATLDAVADEDQCSRLPGGDVPNGQFNRLGVDTVLGTRAWDEQGKFRLRLGPMAYRRFARFLPDSREPDAAFVALCSLVRMYAGLDHEFDVRLVLAAGEVPPLTLGEGAEGFMPRLGWNTWFGDGGAQGDRDEVLFDPADVPSTENARA